MKDLSKETCIIPPREVYEDVDGSTRPTAGTYNFVTECFFMTHKALDLGANFDAFIFFNDAQFITIIKIGTVVF